MPKFLEVTNKAAARAAINADVNFAFEADETTTAAEITAWLAEPYDGWKRLVGSATINAPIVIPSDTKLDMTGATLTLANGSNCRMMQNAACTPLRVTSADAVCVAGDNTVTTASGSFTSADVGRVLAVAFTNESDRGINAYGRITTINSSTSVEIEPAPMFTQSGGVARVYGRDKNIEIRGGFWDKGINQGTGTNYVQLNLYRVDGVRVENMLMYAPRVTGARGYAVQFGDCTDIDADYRVDNWGDGCHLIGPIHNGRIRVTGRSGDDTIGITTTNYGPYNDTHGDIEDLDLWAEGDPNGARIILLATSASQNAAAGGVSGPLTPGAQFYPDGHSLRRIKVHRARDTSPTKNSLGVITWVQSDDEDSRVDDLVVENAECDVSLYHNAHGKVILENVTGDITLSAGPAPYPITAAVIDDLTLINCTGMIQNSDSRVTITKLTKRGGSIPYLSLGCDAVGSVLMDRVTFTERLYGVIRGCSVGTMTFAHCTGTTTYTAGIGRISGSSSVSEINIHNCNLASTAPSNGALATVASGSSLGTLRVSNSKITDMGNILVNSGSSQVRLFMSDLVMDGCERIAEGGGGAIIQYANLYHDCSLNPFYCNGNTTIIGSGYLANRVGYSNDVVKAGSAVVRVIDTRIQADVGDLAKNLGDMAFNNDFSLACGTGPVISNGSLWKNLYTGATS